MKETIKGHAYLLDDLQGDGNSALQFFMDPALHYGNGFSGPSTQEVLRACIARVKALNEEEYAPENREIINNLRAAIILFETRALRRKMEKDPEGAEALIAGKDGHVFTLWDDLS